MKLINIRNTISFYILLLAFTLTGCEEYLTEKNPSDVTTDFLFSTSDGLKAAVSGLYNVERNQLFSGDGNSFALIMGDGGTDIDFDRAAEQDIARYRNDIDLSIKPSISTWWRKWYMIIERSNSIIAFGEEADIAANEKMNILREAYLYRAYAYFWLVRKYDNIWLNLDPTTYQNIEGRTFSVASQNDVYNQIVADLDKAIEYYGDDWTIIPGRLNQGVARLLRADVALWLQDYQTAARQSVKIIKDGPFNLEAPENIFTKDGRQYTKESMYVMQFDDEAAGGGTFHRLSLIFTSQYRSISGCISATEFGGYGWARIHPNPYLISLYDSKYDKRWNAWWQHYYTFNDPGFDFSKVTYHFGDTVRLKAYPALKGDNYFKYCNISCKKYWDWQKIAISTNPYNNVYMFRYPQVLLIASEAYMRLNKNDSALFYINQIRRNRILSSSPNQLLTTISEDLILDEYAREMAFEGQRWFLLKRVGKLVERVKLYGGITSFRGEPAPTPDYYVCRTNIKPHHIRWPIPRDERDAMGGFPQNEGYYQ